LTQALLSSGFKVIDLSFPIRADDDPVEVAKKISHNSAELLIVGIAKATPLEDQDKKLGGMSSHRAVLNARVLETGTGEVIATISQVASGLEATPELSAQKAFAQTAELAKGELVSLPQQLADKAHVEITLQGLKSFEMLSNFEKKMSSEPSVKDLYLRSYNQENGVALVDVLVDQISVQELSDRVLKIGGPEWTLLQVSGRSIQVSTSPAGR
jgi:hypothetical protein